MLIIRTVQMIVTYIIMKYMFSKCVTISAFIILTKEDKSEALHVDELPKIGVMHLCFFLEHVKISRFRVVVMYYID